MRPKLKVTSNDVARLAGVSQSTVSKVANNSEIVTAATRAKVIQAAHELGYTLTPRTDGLFHVALIIPGPSIVGYTSEVLSGLLIDLLKQKIKLEIVSGNQLEILNERSVNCAISINWEKEFYDSYKRTLSLPLVRIGGASSHHEDIYSVTSDGMFSLKFLVDKLWNLNHRKIGFFFFDPFEHEVNTQSRRRAGFLTAMRSHGVEDPEEFCTYNCTERDEDELVELLRKWYDAGVTALIFANSYGTGKMMKIIRMANIKVPSELSVIGWEFPRVSEYTDPPLSTLDMDPFGLASTAVNLLKQILNKKDNLKDIYLPYKYIERKSVAPARITPPECSES